MTARCCFLVFFFFSSRRRHTRCSRDWSSDVCSSDLLQGLQDAGPLHGAPGERGGERRERERPVPVDLDELASRSEERSEEHTSELQSRLHLVCRLLLEKKKKSTCQNSSNGYISYAVI